MVSVKDKGGAFAALLKRLGKFGAISIAVLVGLVIFYGSCTTRVEPNEFGVEQVRLGSDTGIRDEAYGPGIYVMPAGSTMHMFPREIHVLEAVTDRTGRTRLRSGRSASSLDEYIASRDRLLGPATHRTIGPLNIQTSDGYAVSTDVTLLYAIKDPVRIAKDFGWGSGYIDGFVTNTFRNAVLTTLGKMSAEAFYNEKARNAAIAEAEAKLREQFEPRGFSIHRLLIRHYEYSDSYERSLQDKKVAVQVTERNKKESLVNEERAKLQQIESKGNATITIAESEVEAQISKVKAESDLYASETRAKADKELGLAQAEAKRLKADALTVNGGRYVVALEVAEMFDAIESGVMTPEQYTQFVRSAWSLLGLGNN